MGKWHFTMNIYASEKTPLVKKPNEEPIPKDRRAILWHRTDPFFKVTHTVRAIHIDGKQYRHAVVRQHCKYDVNGLTPTVIAFHADRAEHDSNALVWVRKTTSLKRHKEVCAVSKCDRYGSWRRTRTSRWCVGTYITCTLRLPTARW